MDGPRTPTPSLFQATSAGTSAKLWAGEVALPPRSIDRPLLRSDAETVEVVTPAECRVIIERLAVTVAKLACGDIVVPPSVSPQSLSALASEGLKQNVHVAKNSSDEFIIKSEVKGEALAAYFALLSPDQLVLTAGVLTDRGLDRDWPLSWRNYNDCGDKRVLDSCCGGGGKVQALRKIGIDAHGVDMCSWGVDIPPFLHYGRAERLPFVDGAFDRVESRMGVLLWGQANRQTCREALAEMVRVTSEGGLIRIASVRGTLLRDLVSERTDVSFTEHQVPDYGAVELVVRREKR